MDTTLMPQGLVSRNSKTPWQNEEVCCNYCMFSQCQLEHTVEWLYWKVKKLSLLTWKWKENDNITHRILGTGGPIKNMNSQLVNEVKDKVVETRET